jgi:endonuclease/exonuclease/phosphatase family metal-dependent hydrolase
MNCQILTYNVHGLPWSKQNSVPICAWIKETQPSIVCLQEVFTESARAYYKDQLEREGYRVCIPRDSGVTLLPSGLVTAVREKDFQVLSDCFCPYLHYHNVELFANKGFHALQLRCLKTQRRCRIVNTHTQSDTEISWWWGTAVTTRIRRAQFQQILSYLHKCADPVLIAGDLNCEASPHPYVRFLKPPVGVPLRKSTFYSTGEDLDHIAWLPLQWAREGCHYCDVVQHGPQMESCVVYEKPWSDHAPIVANVRIPLRDPK